MQVRRFWMLMPLVLGTAAPQPSTVGNPADFSIVVTRHNQEWTGTCESGCRWQKVTAAKPRILGRSVWIDDTGISMWGSGAADSTSRWGFRLTATKDGWSASDAQGTRWSSLAFSCKDGTCTARITDEGVEGLSAAAAWDSTLVVGQKVRAWSKYPKPGWREGVVSEASYDGKPLCPVIDDANDSDAPLLLIGAVDSLEIRNTTTSAWERVDMGAVKAKYARCRTS